MEEIFTLGKDFEFFIGGDQEDGVDKGSKYCLGSNFNVSPKGTPMDVRQEKIADGFEEVQSFGPLADYKLRVSSPYNDSYLSIDMDDTKEDLKGFDVEANESLYTRNDWIVAGDGGSSDGGKMPYKEPTERNHIKFVPVTYLTRIGTDEVYNQAMESETFGGSEIDHSDMCSGEREFFNLDSGEKADDKIGFRVGYETRLFLASSNAYKFGVTALKATILGGGLDSLDPLQVSVLNMADEGDPPNWQAFIEPGMINSDIPKWNGTLLTSNSSPSMSVSDGDEIWFTSDFLPYSVNLGGIYAAISTGDIDGPKFVQNDPVAEAPTLDPEASGGSFVTAPGKVGILWATIEDDGNGVLRVAAGDRRGNSQVVWGGGTLYDTIRH